MGSRAFEALSSWLNSAWYRRGISPMLIPFLPLSWLVRQVASRRYVTYQVEKKKQWRPPVPIVVVGNITVGGTGKTPLVMALVKKLQGAGLFPGVVSRGYGGSCSMFPRIVTEKTNPFLVGDEPVMMAKQLDVPVVVAHNRRDAVRYLLEYDENCSVIVSDDGLQHIHLWRDVEIAVLDGMRMMGNEYCIPVGPLRESPSRLKTVDAVVVNGTSTGSLEVPSVHMQLKPLNLVNMVSGETITAEQLPQLGSSVLAVAAIGHPQRFFRELEFLGVAVKAYAFPDHHNFVVDDFSFCNREDIPVIMTAKDAVKCVSFAKKNWWRLDVVADLPESFWRMLFEKIAYKSYLCRVALAGQCQKETEQNDNGYDGAQRLAKVEKKQAACQVEIIYRSAN